MWRRQRGGSDLDFRRDCRRGWNVDGSRGRSRWNRGLGADLQIEPRIDRAGDRVEVIGLWWEDGFDPNRAEGFVDAMREALGAYLRFAGVERLQWASPLAKNKRVFVV